MKICPKCMQSLPLLAFASRGFGKGPTSYCKQCQRIYCKAHYRTYAPSHNARRYKHIKGCRKFNSVAVRRYLSQMSCVDCGEADSRVLEFDHVRGEKVGNIGTLCSQGVSWRTIELEIAKCEVRCANCHRRRTAEQLRWWRNIGA